MIVTTSSLRRQLFTCAALSVLCAFGAGCGLAEQTTDQSAATTGARDSPSAPSAPGDERPAEDPAVATTTTLAIGETDRVPGVSQRADIPAGCRIVMHTIAEDGPVEREIVNVRTGEIVARAVGGSPWQPDGWRERCGQ